jgi:formate dehydrogenase iron-sulfur subunit
MQAWRAWMGWRTSWLSREILIFGLHGPLAVTYAWFGLSAVGFLAAVTGLVGIISSGMLYHVTQREWWRGVRSVGRFLLTSLVLGSATAAMLGSIAPWVVVASAMLKLAAELRATHEWLLARSLCLLHGELGGLHRGRLLIACFGGVFCPLFWAAQTELSLGLCVIAELLERVLFFRAVTVTRMPGWNVNLASHS